VGVVPKNGKVSTVPVESLPHASGGGPVKADIPITEVYVFPTLVGVVRGGGRLDPPKTAVFPTLVGVVRSYLPSLPALPRVFPTLVGVVRLA